MYNCRIENFMGYAADNGGTVSFTRALGSIFLTYNRDSVSFNRIANSFRDVAGARSKVDQLVTNADSTAFLFSDPNPSQRPAVRSNILPTITYANGSTYTHNINSYISLGNLNSPITDYQYRFTGLQITYYVPPISGFLQRRVLNVYSSAFNFRTLTEFNAGMSAIGLPEFQVTLPDTVYEPSIVCLQQGSTTTTARLTPISAPVRPDGGLRVTIVDGDPPYLAHVSATEPTHRGIGDMWFNPSNGNLSVYTE